MGDESQTLFSCAYQSDIEQKIIEKTLELNAQSQSKQLVLSKKRLLSLPDKIYDLEHLQFITLEGNEIEVIPEIFSLSLVQLVWLDLRNNNLRSLPANISKLFHLKNLLLENNKLHSLPLELGYLTSLTGLNLFNNPLVFPPKHVIEIGVKGILKFLREKLCHQYSTENSYLDDNESIEEKIYSSCLVSSEDSFESQALDHFNSKIEISEQFLNESLLYSVTTQKDKTCELFQSNQQTFNQSNQHACNQSNQQTCKQANQKTSKQSNLYFNTQHATVCNSNHACIHKDSVINSIKLEEKISQKFQKKDDKSVKKLRNNEILTDWRTKTKNKQNKIQSSTSIININIPYGNDLPVKYSKNNKNADEADEILKVESSKNSLQKVEQQIYEHSKKLKLGNQNARLLDANEALKCAEDNLNEALNLQKELERNRPLEYRFKAFFS